MPQRGLFNSKISWYIMRYLRCSYDSKFIFFTLDSILKSKYYLPFGKILFRNQSLWYYLGTYFFFQPLYYYYFKQITKNLVIFCQGTFSHYFCLKKKIDRGISRVWIKALKNFVLIAWGWLLLKGMTSILQKIQ